MERRYGVRALVSLAALLLGGGCPEGKTPPATVPCDPSTPGSCGSTALICVDGACYSCATGTLNCNGESSDGCEQAGQCGGPPPECDVAQASSCGTPERYCSGGACVDCPAGTASCDGVNGNGCEANTPCGSPACDPAAVNSCGSENLYCDGLRCIACPAGWKNCDGASTNQCEQQATCDPSCDEAAAGSCGTQGYCVSGACTPCASGQLNCDGVNANGCEYPGNTPQVLTDTGSLSGSTSDQGLPDHCSMTKPMTYVLQVTTAAPTSLQMAVAAHKASFSAVSLRSACGVDNGCGIGSSTLSWTHTVAAGTYYLVVATDVATPFDIGVAFNSPP